MEENSISTQVFSALRKSAATMRSEVYNKLLGRDLTLRQFTVLEALYREGPVSVGKLAWELAATGEAAGRVVAGLEKRKLVARRRGDQGHSMVVLTTEGGKVINTLVAEYSQLVEQIMDRLTAAEQENLKRLCGRFIQAGEGL